MKKILLIVVFMANGFLYAQNTFPTTGKVGIGTTSPLYPLTIITTSNANAFGLADGTSGVLIQTQNTPTSNGGVIGYYNGTYNDLDIRATAGTGNQLYLKASGNVGIGTRTPDAKLAVNGIIHAKEVKVDLTGWADYVFEPTYQLLSLSDVKSYIDKNHRLPDMPSEQQIKKEGLNVGEMNKLLAKKIEELTLYLIEKDNQLAEQQQQIQQLKQESARIDTLEKILSSLVK